MGKLLQSKKGNTDRQRKMPKIPLSVKEDFLEAIKVDPNIKKVLF